MCGKPFDQSESQVQSPVVAAAGQAACDAGPSHGCGAGVVAHVVSLSGAHATALHVAATDTETEARQTPHTGTVAQAGVVETRLCHRGRICVQKSIRQLLILLRPQNY